MKIDLTKKYKTDSDKPVTLVSDQGRSPFPIIGYLGDRTKASVWTADGYFLEDKSNHPCNLVEVPETEVAYVNFYRDNTAFAHPTRNRADVHATDDRIACVRVEYVEGQFDK